MKNFVRLAILALVGIALTYLYCDAAGNKEGTIHFHCKYIPVTEDGFLE